MAARKSDPQQYRLYRMERADIGARTYARLTFRMCQVVARSVCKAYGVQQVKVVREPLGRWAAEWHTDTIRLNPGKGTATDLVTILHELAHHVHYHIAADASSHQDHGPEFMAAYLSIFDTVRFLPRRALMAVCDWRKIDYIDPGPSIKSLRRALDSRRGKAPVLHAYVATVQE